ncbi:MAG: PaaI family thioesterase [Marinobacter sp.]|uniref:PaaI family thioesterase n=1 Tax=Marinobacter sp. TaxID=50741 RepID=UPI00299DA46D|nr:PaaI family thioesterase [Marinobacter sp.]MDX1635905.1 PaaI family thioesterase [Marinobacter sp.]
MTAMEPRLDKVINHPLHQHLGITSIRSEAGEGRFAIAVSERVINPAGMLHGGVVYLLSDVCAYAGLLSLLDAGTEAVTHDIQVSVMAPARLGDTVAFESRVVKLGKRLCFLEVVATVEGRVLATSKVTKSILST